MTITAFATNTENGLAGAAGDLLAFDATFDDSTAQNENAQILVWLWMLVKVIRARQRHAVTSQTIASKKDRIFAYVGEHTAYAMMQVCSMIQPVYNELYAVFNSVDESADDPWGTNLGTNGSGPVGGPLHGYGSGG